MKSQLIWIVAGLVVGPAGLKAQIGDGYGSGAALGIGRGRGGGIPVEYQFQQAGTIGAAAGRGGGMAPRVSAVQQAVTGRPVSATEERKSVQTLGDGTEISNSESNLFYRDSQGRTRVEQVWQGRTVVAILDPVDRFWAEINPDQKTANKYVIPPNAGAGGISISGGVVNRTGGFVAYVAKGTGVNGGISLDIITQPFPQAGAARGGRGGALVPSRNTVNEDLGVHSVNGVLANGTRNTLTIPEGQIGNNRDIHVVNERWFSDDLQMMVKSVNSDPRFGETTYQLTDISRIEPDLGLFQIPLDYSVTNAGGRGGRGVSPDMQITPRPVIK